MCTRRLDDGTTFFVVGHGKGKDADVKLYCEDDYTKIFKQPCPKCGLPIEDESDELRWHTHTDDSTGKTYYHDVLDNKTQWEKPENLDEPLAGYSVLLYEKRWHSRCLVCSADGCDASLWGQGKTAHLADNGHLYCKEHFSSLLA